ncbi:uncharacterized protein [Palaemon carinicauda]|uniref:uncharacterized protein n=1 Tax=Palaemon carinicauda TaxID=392227 RepID=UPI0035B5F985
MTWSLRPIASGFVFAQSFVEFARTKEEQFDDWSKSRQFVTFTALHELQLLEEFNKASSRELRVHLEEVKAAKMSNAAQLADEYVLTHRSGSGNFDHDMLNNPSPCTPRGGTTRSNNNENRVSGCRGHFQSQCNACRYYLDRNGQSPAAVIPDKSHVNSSTVDRSVVDSSNVSSNVKDVPNAQSRLEFDKYIWPGKVICDNSVVQVKCLRDTGSARSLILKTTLNGGTEYTGNFVVLGGFPDSVVFAPFINVHLSFPGYDQITELAVVDSLPIPGIDGFLGNDLLDGEGRELFPIVSINASHVAITTRSAARAANLLDGDNDDVSISSSVELHIERPGSVESHLGMLKTFHSLARYFWCPGMKVRVKQFIRECETCQVIGKPNQCIPKTLLHPILAIGEPFSEYGLPRVILTDCWTNFTSKVFRGKCAELAIQHITSIPYHPESQGLVERFHQTLQTVLKKHCYDSCSEWDKALPFALFAIRNHPNSSRGVAPFKWVFGHKVRGLLEIIFEILKSSQKGEVKVEGLVEDLKSRMLNA